MTVVLEEITDVHRAVRQRGEPLPGRPFGVLDHAAHNAADVARAVGGEQGLQPVHGHVQRGDEGADVQARRGGEPGRSQDHLEHVSEDFAYSVGYVIWGVAALAAALLAFVALGGSAHDTQADPRTLADS